MNSIKNVSFKIAAFGALLLSPLSVFAGPPPPTMVINTTTGGATAIPTLSGPMLVVLSLLLFSVATRVVKQKNTGVNKMLVTLVGVGTLSLVTGGVKIVSTANAALHGFTPFVLEDLTLGESTITLSSGPSFTSSRSYNVVTNNTPGAMIEVLSINPSNNVCGPALDGGGGPITVNGNLLPNISGNTCAVGTKLNFEEGCELQCIDIVLESTALD